MSRLWKTFGNYGSSRLSVGLEEFDNITNPETGERVGDVDESTELAVIHQESAEISQDVDAIQQSVDHHDNGEDAAVIMDNANASDSVTPETAGLATIATGTIAKSISGSDDVAESVSEGVAQESSGKYTYATEGFKEFLKESWRKIVEFVKSVIRRIKDAWNRFWNSTAKLVKKAKELKKNAEERSGKASSDTTSVSMGLLKTLAYTMNGKFDSKLFAKDVSDIFTDATKSIKEVPDDISKMANGFKKIYDDMVNNKELMEKGDIDAKMSIEVKAGLISWNKMLKGAKSNEHVTREFGKDYVGVAHPLPFGNKAGIVAFKDPKDKNTTNEVINSFTAKIVDYHENGWKPVTKGGKMEVDTLELSEIIDIADAIIKFGEGIEDFYNKGSKKCQDEINSFEKDIDEKIKKIDDSASLSARQVAKSYQRSYIIPTQLLRLTMDMSVYFIRAGYQAISLGNSMVTKYDKKDDKK